MASRKVIIIGGGVAGLSLGCYLRMNCYETEVLEQSAAAGGVCAAWTRKGYTFDGATEWLPGSAPPLNLHDILAEIVDFSRLEIAPFPQFTRVERGGKVLRAFTDVKRLESELLDIAPEDAGPIHEFTDAISQVSSLVLPVQRAPELTGILDHLRSARTLVPLLLFIRKWRGTTISQFAQRLENPDLRAMLPLIFPRHDFFSVMGLIFALGWMNMGCAGHPVGGSRRFMELVEGRYSALGGTLRLRSRVETIRTTMGAARGVVLEGGETLNADIVVSAADARSTLLGMLGGKHLSRRFRGLFASAVLFPGTIQVSLGLDRTFDGDAHKYLLHLDRPVGFGTDRDIPHVIVKLSNIDPTLAPEGKTAVVAHLRTRDDGHWLDLRADDRPRYREEKERAAEAVIDLLESRFGGVREAIEVKDVATPATYVRYTSNWRGSYQGWAPIPSLIGRSLEKTVPGLGGFYMTGQWVEPGGGLPKVVISARNVAQIICHDDGLPFTASRAG
ncbi:MAG: NAD(P)/FAD-dependent oxidoreductase [Deltaproteobacteria bacterium]|nr:NAD(P)/FAD-dependent oxidoreductase [Deltaproteobacteria bacterium]